MKIKSIHHIAIIVSDYEASKAFYTDILGCSIIAETYREERQSYKLDLVIGNQYCIELFSFPEHKPRASYPEALGLRHLAFAVEDIKAAYNELLQRKIPVEPIRIDELTGKSFLFFTDPDGLPLELYEE